MTNATHFFLGANSGLGFQNMFDKFCQTEDHFDLLVLKGGPGAGKSTMMKRIGKLMESHGEQVEYLHCSGDPDSLDGVNIPRIRTAVVDGTSPHVIEPRYPAAVERYVNLGQFYNIAAAKSAKAEIMQRTDECSTAYRQAYRALGAARHMEDSADALAAEGLDRERLVRRTKGIIAREIRGKGSGEGVRYRFMGSVTCKGIVERIDSVQNLCPRVYFLHDSFSLAAPMLRGIYEAARAREYGVILCPDPEHMDRLHHLLIPELGLGFVTVGQDGEYGVTPYRRIHVNEMVSSDHMRKWKGRLKLLGKMKRTLLQEGIQALSEAKAAHDALEALYHPNIDTVGLDEYTAQEAARIVTYL